MQCSITFIGRQTAIASVQKYPEVDSAIALIIN